MNAINKEATKVMDILTANLTTGSRTIDNTKGAFMAVHVERVSEIDLGPIFSVAHYYEQNGDLMRDPDVEFLKATNAAGENLYFPISFWQDGYPTVRNEAVVLDDSGRTIKGVRKKMQASITRFCNTWMRNIKHQQNLKKSPVSPQAEN